MLDILTHENVGGQTKLRITLVGGPTTTTLESDRIWHDGQIIAVVVADTYEAAREAAHKVEVSYVEEPPGATFNSARRRDRAAPAPIRSGPAEGRRRGRLRRGTGKGRGPLPDTDPTPQSDRALHCHLRLGRAEADHL